MGCQAKKVGFLKMHGCGSTSILNILLRNARKNNLNLVLHNEGLSFYEDTFHRGMLKGTLWEKANLSYDMFVLHSRWNHSEIANTLNDHGDVVYISNIHDPVDMFASIWDKPLNKPRRVNQTLEEFARSLKSNESQSSSSFKERYGHVLNGLAPGGFGQGQFFFRFGSDITEIGDQITLERKIKDIDAKFDKILITDQDTFDDSMIILKEALCWEYKDIVNFKLNSITTDKKSYLSYTGRHNLKGNFIVSSENVRYS